MQSCLGRGDDGPLGLGAVAAMRGLGGGERAGSRTALGQGRGARIAWTATTTSYKIRKLPEEEQSVRLIHD
jgi:hypothetical protein